MSTVHRRIALILLVVCSMSAHGCYSGIRSWTWGDPVGISYYLPAPYLIVERTVTDNDAVWDARVEIIADSSPSQTYFIQPFAILAKQDAMVELNPDGTLKSVALTQDATPISAAVVEAVKEVWLKKLELQKSAATAAAERSAEQSANMRPQGSKKGPDSDKKKDDKPDEPGAIVKDIWILRITGTTVEEPTSRSFRIPILLDHSPKATGKIEGSFSIPVEPSKVNQTAP